MFASASQFRLLVVYVAIVTSIWTFFEFRLMVTLPGKPYDGDWNHTVRLRTREEGSRIMESLAKPTTRKLATLCGTTSSQTDGQAKSADIELVKTEVEVSKDGDSMTVTHQYVVVGSDPIPDLYCLLWREGDLQEDGLVTGTDVQKFWGRATEYERLLVLTCQFPSVRPRDFPEYLTAVVPDPCRSPETSVRLSEARLRTEHLPQVTANTITDDAPNWNVRWKYVFKQEDTNDVKDPSTCTQLHYETPHLSSSPDWLEVEHNVTYMYSVHVDIRHKTGGVLVKGFGLVNKTAMLESGRPAMYCQLMLGGRGSPVVVKAEVFDLLSGRRLEIDEPRYRDVEIRCLFKELHLMNLVHPVMSYVTKPCTKPNHYLRVNVPKVYASKTSLKFLVGLSGPINNYYNNYHRLVEWVELNMLYGAQGFVVYDYDSGPDVRRYLRYYEEHGIVRLHRWTLPTHINVTDNSQMWYYGQRILINDCLYRYMFSADRMAFFDLDEFIVPKPPLRSWSTMLKKAECFQAAYTMANNVIFRLDWPDDLPVPDLAPLLQQDLRLVSLLKTTRENVLYPINKRAKYIIRPRLIDNLLVHRPYPVDIEHEDPCPLTPDIGLLHHYREGFVNNDRHVHGSVRDRTVWDHTGELIVRTSFVHSQVDEEQSGELEEEDDIM